MVEEAKSASSTLELDAKPSLDDNAKLADVHLFQDDTLASHWSDVYENAKYEGRHRFDPNVQWTRRQERNLVRRLDLRIMIWVWIMFLVLDLVRYNVSRALAAANFLSDLDMTQDDVNNGQTIFYLCFLAMELPSGLMSKWLGPERWVPFQIIAWSTVCAAQTAIQNRGGFFVCRALIAICQGGFVPDMCLYLTYFYTSEELNIRMGLFYTVLGLSQAIDSLLSAGFLSLDGLNGLAGWRYLFAFDALISGAVGFFAIFMMPASITSTKNMLFRKSMFSEEEEKILVNRLLRDDPSKGDMNNREAVDWKAVWRCITDYDAWVIYILAFVSLIPYQPPLTYLSFILKSNLGFSTFKSNMLAIPSQVLFAINALWMAWLAMRFGQRSLLSSITNIWVFPCLVALVALPHRNDGPFSWYRYALISLVNAVPYPLAFMVGWISKNSHSVRTRTISLCILNMWTQIGGIVASHVYTDSDQPLYIRGNTAMAVVAAFAIVLSFATKAYFVARNRSKQRKWDRLSPEEKIEYSLHSTDFGPRRLDTRLAD